MGLFLYLCICVLEERNIDLITQGPGKTSSGILHTFLLNHDKDEPKLVQVHGRATRKIKGMKNLFF